VTGFDHVRDGDLATMAQPLDALGVNYYTRGMVRASGRTPNPAAATPLVGSDDVEVVPRGLPVTEMGWEVDPDGLYDILTRVWRDYGPLPLYITENGAAFADQPTGADTVEDPDRVSYLDGHFRAAHRALTDGVDLRGYFVWSLMDNFEWAFGYSKRFGLMYVDYATLRRIPKRSARWYRAVIAHHGLPATQPPG
jgi:beta-glucosidase